MYTELLAEGVTVTPVVDYCLIVARTIDSKPADETLYAIRTVINGTGTVDLNKTSAEDGETVVITLSAAATAIHVLNNTDSSIVATTQVDTTNVYTFTMPASDVTIIVDFA